jgi:cell division inhibitor SulA
VVTWTSSLDARDSRRLEIVAKSARALGVVIEDVNAHLPHKHQFVNSTLTNEAGNFCSFH